MTRAKANKILREVYAENQHRVGEEVILQEEGEKVMIVNVFKCNILPENSLEWGTAIYDMWDEALDEYNADSLREEVQEFMEANYIS